MFFFHTDYKYTHTVSPYEDFEQQKPLPEYFMDSNWQTWDGGY